MSETHQLVAVMKNLLRSRGLTYADVASRVGLSEASVKRVFAAETFTLKRLEQFCAVLEIDFLELAKLARGRVAEAPQMTDKQEAALARDPTLLAVFYLVLNDWKPADILAHYELTRERLTVLLVQLDRLRLIDFLPGDKVHVRMPRLLRVRRQGPIWRTHAKRVIDDFLAAEFEPAGGSFQFEYRELSNASYELMRRKLEQVTADFLELAELDTTLPADQRRTIGLAVGIRPWSLSLVTGLAPARQNARRSPSTVTRTGSARRPARSS